MLRTSEKKDKLNVSYESYLTWKLFLQRPFSENGRRVGLSSVRGVRCGCSKTKKQVDRRNPTISKWTASSSKRGARYAWLLLPSFFRSKSITSLNNTLVYLPTGLCIHHDQRGSVWWTNDVVNDWVLDCCMFVCVCGGGGGGGEIAEIRGGF